MTDLHNQTPEPSPESLSPEELIRYRELLTLAYPQPKRDVCAAVMMQIRMEAAAKKKRLRGVVLRWGSLAACAALVILIGMHTLPGRMMKSADYAVPETAVAAGDKDDAALERAAAPKTTEEGAGVGNSPFLSGTAPAAMAPTEEAAVTEDGGEAVVEEVCEEEVCEAAPMEASAPEPEEANAFADNAADGRMEKFFAAAPAAMADVSDYVHHCEYSGAFRDSYHFIPLSLISLVGEEAYAEWESGRETCVNLPDLAIAFGLTAEEIWEVGNLWYYVDLPEDVPLTEENRDAIREYYRDGGNYAEMVRRYTEYEYKNALISLVGVAEYTRWCGGASLRSWTADDLARDFGLTEEQLRTAYDKAAAKVAAEYPGDGK